jgi:hypothetical protein
MKKQQKQGWMKRLFNWILEPFFIIGSAWKAIVPRKATEEELRVFKELTPGQRWLSAKEKHGWTTEQLDSERKWSYRFAYAAIFSCLLILLGTYFSLHYMSIFQTVGAIAYSGAAFLLFAKKSILVYAIDNQQILLIEDWLMQPSIWLPVSVNDKSGR